MLKPSGRRFYNHYVANSFQYNLHDFETTKTINVCYKDPIKMPSWHPLKEDLFEKASSHIAQQDRLKKLEFNAIGKIDYLTFIMG